MAESDLRDHQFIFSCVRKWRHRDILCLFFSYAGFKLWCVLHICWFEWATSQVLSSRVWLVEKAHGHTVSQWQTWDQHSGLLAPLQCFSHWENGGGSYISQATISQSGCLQEITFSLGISSRGDLFKDTQAIQELRNHWAISDWQREHSTATPEAGRTLQGWELSDGSWESRVEGCLVGDSGIGGGSVTGGGRLCLTLVGYWMKLLRSQLARDMGNAGQSSARVGWTSGNKQTPTATVG